MIGKVGWSPDWKPEPRRRDPDLFRLLHIENKGKPCAAGCGNEGQELHHWKLRSQGGHDTRENLRWLCRRCHRALHGNPWVDAEGRRWTAQDVTEALWRSRCRVENPKGNCDCEGSCKASTTDS